MNPTQTQNTIAPIVAFLAGLLAGKGVFGFDSATWAMILGAVFGLGATIWAAVTTRKNALTATVAAMPEVKEVALDKTAPGAAAMDAATPNNVVMK